MSFISIRIAFIDYSSFRPWTMLDDSIIRITV